MTITATKTRKSDASSETPAAETKKVVAYKGFDLNLQCRGHQFEVGKSYEVEGRIIACENGFHACPYPTAVFEFYPAATSRFAVVELEGDMEEHGGNKIAARKITVIRELTLAELIREAVTYTTSRAKPEGETASGYRGAATASGYQGAATASGEQGAATASGYRGAATASGYQGAATASGEQGAATASGYQGAATASGERGAATASGYRGAATASGYQGAATASGYQGAATASGYQGAATASGEQGAATASGYQGAATASGEQGAATASGEQSVAMGSGFYARARGRDGTALFLVERNDDWSSDNSGEILHAWAGIVGKDGIKPDTFYTLKDGKPVEVDE